MSNDDTKKREVLRKLLGDGSGEVTDRDVDRHLAKQAEPQKKIQNTSPSNAGELSGTEARNLRSDVPRT